MNTDETFSYWKKPYEKWLLLLQGILVFITLYFDMKNFIDISDPEYRNRIFTQIEWQNYVMKRYFSFTISILLISIFIGLFIIGCVVKREKTARRSEGILFIVLGILWCFIRVPIKILDDFTLNIWVILLICIVVGAFYSIYKSIKIAV